MVKDRQGIRTTPTPSRKRRAAAALGAVITGVGALGVGALSAGGEAAAATGGFSVTGALATARTHAVAAVLSGGDVLVAGGQNAAGTPLDSAELFDPTKGTWKTVPSLPLAVTDATATRLSDGDVLVAGGLTSGSSAATPTDAAELYDPTSNSWKTTGQLPFASYDASAVRLGGGGVLYAGGLTATGAGAAATAQAALYDPGNGTWTTVASLPTGVAGAAAAPLGDGGALVAGGVTGVGAAPTAATETFANGSWTTRAAMPTPASGAATVVLGDGRVLIAGGRVDANGTPTAATRLFDPAGDNWQSAAPLPTAVFAPAATRLSTGNVLLAGGMMGGGAVSAAAALFDPAHGTWTAEAPLALGVAYGVAAPIGSADALVASGTTSSGVTNESEEFVGGNAPVITSPATFAVRVGVATRLDLAASGVPAPTLGLRGTLPPGMVFSGGSAGTATISGEPRQPGTFSVELVASNGVGPTVTQQVRIVVGEAPRFTTPAAFSLQAGHPVRIVVRAVGTPTPVLRLSGALPPGLAFSPLNGGAAVISGVLRPEGHPSFNLTVVANNGIGGDVVQQLVLRLQATPVIHGPGTLSVTDGHPVSLTFSATGRPTPRWRLIGRLPAGLSFHPAADGTARITGRPALGDLGRYSVTLQANNGVGATTHQLVIVARSESSPRGIGYWYTTRTGRVIGKGAARPIAPHSPQNPRDIVAMAALPGGNGYFLASSFGGVFAYGAALFRGSITHLHLHTPVVDIAATPNGGYVLVTRRGNVFNFGGARFYGSLAGRSVGPVAGIALLPGDTGYFLLTTSGRVFSFGAARNYGSPRPRRVPAVGIAAAPNGRGYWVVFSDGAVANFGAARFYGSLANRRIPPVQDLVPTGNGFGYWIVTRAGNIFNFGNARFFGSSVHGYLPGGLSGFAPEL